ncbi:MAG: hypothetical protein IKQ06_05870 [Bacilli bacterium]|nr:hypothetical protein [Bacilli bacterium]
MKQKNYEKKTLVLFLTILLWIIEICFIIYLSNIRIIEYKLFQVIMISNKEGVVYLSKEDKKLFYKSSYYYYKDKKYYFEIIDEKKVNDLIEIKLKTSIKNLKENDIITISIENKRISELETIIDIWGGDKNSKG